MSWLWVRDGLIFAVDTDVEAGLLTECVRRDVIGIEGVVDTANAHLLVQASAFALYGD